jgi:hypothetical protein
VPRGGKREGAGGKVGGYRKPKLPVLASPKVISDTIQQHLAKYPHHDPVMLLLRFANDEGLPVDTRIHAAQAAAPYCRPKLSTVTINRTPTAPDESALHRLRQLIERHNRDTIDITPTSDPTVVPLHKP